MVAYIYNSGTLNGELGSRDRLPGSLQAIAVAMNSSRQGRRQVPIPNTWGCPLTSIYMHVNIHTHTKYILTDTHTSHTPVQRIKQ